MRDGQRWLRIVLRRLRRADSIDSLRGSQDRLPLKNALMLDLEFTSLSDCGRRRDHNEDYLGHVTPASPSHVRTHGWMFALADGVGGQELGEVASRCAVESIVEGFRRAPKGESHGSLLPRLLQSANVEVFETGRTSGPGGVAMATTIVACALKYDRVAIAHVGDSRCYLIRDGQATPLTRDHTVANEHVRLGLLTAREATEVDTKHLLSRSLGTDMFVNVETCEKQVIPHDVLLLCSDGMHGSVEGSDMAKAVSPRVDLNTAARELVALANQRDGGDNISVHLIRVLAVERVGMYRGRPYKLP